MTQQKISPSLWFDMNCEEAVNFYTSIFDNSKIIHLQKYPDTVDDEHMKGMEGKILTAIFELEGHRFMALDGGPIFKLNPSISFFVNFDPSKEDNARERLDELWSKLADGGDVKMELGEYPFSKHYGWVQDKYGVSWQLILSDPEGDDRPKIMPSLLFTRDMTGRAEEAMDFYLSVFKNAQKGMVAHYESGQAPNAQAKVAYADFKLEDYWLSAMDSGVEQDYGFNEAISLYVECKDQAEVDYYWEKLSAVPESEQCGWLKDKFGISWQIIPKRMGELLSSKDTEKAGRAMQAMLQMKKIDIAQLEEAYNGS